jgi:hypothetical protein
MSVSHFFGLKIDPYLVVNPNIPTLSYQHLCILDTPDTLWVQPMCQNLENVLVTIYLLSCVGHTTLLFSISITTTIINR